VAVADLRNSCYSVRYSLWRDLGTPSESLVSAEVPTPEAACWVRGLTASVSGQHICLIVRTSVASGARARRQMSATVRVRWPTVWPTVKRRRHSPTGELTSSARLMALGAAPA
jgi:hypothetical protein